MDLDSESGFTLFSKKSIELQNAIGKVCLFHQI